LRFLSLIGTFDNYPALFTSCTFCTLISNFCFVGDFSAHKLVKLVFLIPSASLLIWRQFIVSDRIVYLTDDTFEAEVLNSEGPVLVDYWAEWCGPCKMIAPILDEIASEYDGKVKVAKLNIDENPNTPPKYGIRGIPTLMLFKGGNVEATKVGAVSKSQLTAFIDSNL